MSSAANLKLQRLRVMVKLMLGMGVIVIFYVAFASGFSGAGKIPDVPTMKVDISDLQPGQVKQLLWENRPVIILHRSTEQIDGLNSESEYLTDPSSKNSVQPDFALNRYRSNSPQWFVAIASGTDLGCSLNFLPEHRFADPTKYRGAFRDSCRGSVYDLAGRVLIDQAAERNLVIPPYQLEGNTLFLGVVAP